MRGKERQITWQEENALVERYGAFLHGHPGIEDGSQTQMRWLNNNGLFDKEEVKEFLNEQSDTDRESD